MAFAYIRCWPAHVNVTVTARKWQRVGDKDQFLDKVGKAGAKYKVETGSERFGNGDFRDHRMGTNMFTQIKVNRLQRRLSQTHHRPYRPE